MYSPLTVPLVVEIMSCMIFGSVLLLCIFYITYIKFTPILCIGLGKA